MKLNKLFLMGAIALGLVFASCNKDDDKLNSNPTGKVGDTYVGLTLQFPVPATTRTPKDNYNPLEGEWKGRDVIEDITVYLVTEGEAVTSQHFTKNDFNAINNDGILTPRLAIEAVSGKNVKAYVVINDINSKITGALATAGWTKGQKVEQAIKATTEFEAAFAKAIKLSAVADVAVYDASGKDKVLMTNKEVPSTTNGGQIAVAADVSMEQAKQGVNNQIKVDVTRVASRAIVTMAENATKTIEVKRRNLVTGDEKTTATVTVKEVTYATTGSALQFNPIETTNLQVPDEVYNFMPTAGQTWGALKTAAAGIFDYSDTYGEVETITGAVTAANLKTALEAEKFSKFLLPVTHAEGKYKKGNTPFFAIKATFTVENNKADFPEAEDLSSHTGDFFFGKTDGLFYSTLRKAQLQNAADNGTEAVPAEDAKQEVVTYTAGAMYYNIWINPDVEYGNGKIKKSPIYRNQVYNTHITGFKEIGLSWTPKDDNPDKPDPFVPDDDLQTDKTYLSVQLRVLPYTLHSHSLNLGNDY